MRDIFLQIAEMIKNKKTTQVEVAKQLCVAQSNISSIILGKSKPSKSLIKLAEILYGNMRTTHPEPIIQKAILMMEAMEKHTQESAYDCIQKEKLLEEMKKERSENLERKAA